MTLDLNNYRLDLRKTRDGVWFDVAAWFDRKRVQLAAENGDGAAIRLRHWGAAEMDQALADAEDELNPLGVEQTPEQRRGKLARAIANGLVTGVRGLMSGGDPVACDPDRVEALLVDPELPGLMSMVTTAANALEHYRKAVEATRLGN